MARLRSPISLMRPGGTRMALASAICDSAMGLRNSSIRISPGCGFGSRSVVVDDFDFVGMALSPDGTRIASGEARCKHRATRNCCSQPTCARQCRKLDLEGCMKLEGGCYCGAVR